MPICDASSNMRRNNFDAQLGYSTVDLSVVIFQQPGYPVCVLMAYNYRLGAVQAAAMR